MFSFFKKKSPAPTDAPQDLPVVADPLLPQSQAPEQVISATQEPLVPVHQQDPELVRAADHAQDTEPSTDASVQTDPAPAKTSWLARLRGSLSKTGQSISTLFVGVKVDEELFDELETALIMADTGVEATEHLLKALRARVKKIASRMQRVSNKRCVRS